MVLTPASVCCVLEQDTLSAYISRLSCEISGDNLVTGVQCYEPFRKIALKIHTFSCKTRVEISLTKQKENLICLYFGMIW